MDGNLDAIADSAYDTVEVEHKSYSFQSYEFPSLGNAQKEALSGKSAYDNFATKEEKPYK